MGIFPRAHFRKKAALFFIATTCLSAGAAISGCGGSKPVAVLNGQKLAEADFLKLCETSQLQSQSQGSVGLQVLAQWAQNTLLEQEARKQKVYPSDQELQERIDAFRRREAFSGGNFDEQLRQQGMTMDTFKRTILNSIIAEKVIYRGVELSDAELRKAFDSTKKQRFDIPEQVRISQITVASPEELRQTQNELAGGADFALVARTRSRDPFKESGGQVPQPVPANLPEPDVSGLPISPRVVQTAFKLNEKEVSEPIKVGATWVIVRLEEKIPGKEAKFEDFRDVVRMELLPQKAQGTGKMEENQASVARNAQASQMQVNRPEYKMVEQILKQMAAQAPAPGQAAEHGPHDGHNHGSEAVPAAAGGG